MVHTYISPNLEVFNGTHLHFSQPRVFDGTHLDFSQPRGIQWYTLTFLPT